MSKETREGPVLPLSVYSDWVADERNDTLHKRVELFHWNGIPWHLAPLPGRFHRCQPQTWGYTGFFNLTQRCACGAMRHYENTRWHNRNSRRKGK